MLPPNTSLDIEDLLNRLETGLRTEMSTRKLVDPLLIGILTGGMWIAESLHARLGISEPLGVLNINFYRDDFSEMGVHPLVLPSKLPFSVTNRTILLIDDVFFTGRTVRAALNEIFDYGRPAHVVLGVLIERDGRQIPIRPDCVGTHLHVSAGQRITLNGPEPLQLSLDSA